MTVTQNQRRSTMSEFQIVTPAFQYRKEVPDDRKETCFRPCCLVSHCQPCFLETEMEPGSSRFPLFQPHGVSAHAGMVALLQRNNGFSFLSYPQIFLHLARTCRELVPPKFQLSHQSPNYRNQEADLELASSSELSDRQLFWDSQ